MANSSVTNYSTIDEAFPIAGQDNDSQGFRDNFAAIKDDLQKTSTELTELRTKALLKVKLNGDDILALNNDMQNETISGALLEKSSEKAYNTGNIASSNDANSQINWENGSYQNITLGDDITLKLLGFPPNGQYAKMRLAIYSTGNVTRTASFSAGAGTIRKSENYAAQLTPGGEFQVTSATVPKIVEVWTSDGGSNVFIDYLGTFDAL